MPTLQDYEYRQEETCAFYYVNGEYGWYHEPIDDHALYGYPALGDRRNERFDIVHRDDLFNLETAITAVREGDRVRVNDGGWMDVIDTTSEGFAAVYENGHVEYEIWHHHVPKSMNADTGPRMFKRDDWQSKGRVYCLEVKWESDDHLDYK